MKRSPFSVSLIPIIGCVKGLAGWCAPVLGGLNRGFLLWLNPQEMLPGELVIEKFKL